MRQVCVSSCMWEIKTRAPGGCTPGSYLLGGSRLALGGYQAQTASHNQGDPNATTFQGNWQQRDSSESGSAFLSQWGCGHKGPNYEISPLDREGSQPGEAGEPGGGCHSAGANFYPLELHEMSSTEVTPMCGLRVGGLGSEASVSWVCYGVWCRVGCSLRALCSEACQRGRWLCRAGGGELSRRPPIAYGH